LRCNDHQKSIHRTPCLILFNDNHLIHHKYIYVHIDISDTPPGVS
ncbi:hypothetical protein HMPREF0484_2060, partial [Klebsiella pneumoniae subsp. rhinoscleromatis ATCC 13884]